MRTTYAPPSSKATDEPIEDNLRERFGLTVAVFLRERFGEGSLRPSYPIGTMFLFGVLLVGLGFLRGAGERGDLPEPSVYIALACVVFGSALLSLFGGRFVLFVIFTLLGFLAPILLALLGRIIQPRLLEPASLYSTPFILTVFAFAIATNFMACWRICQALRYPAPHRLAPGRPSRLMRFVCRWTRGPNARQWEMYMLVEPVLVFTVGAAMLLVFANWFGLFLLIISVLMAEVAIERYFRAQKQVVEAVSGITHGQNRMEQVEVAMGETPRAQASPTAQSKFVARPVGRSGQEG